MFYLFFHHILISHYFLDTFCFYFLIIPINLYFLITFWSFSYAFFFSIRKFINNTCIIHSHIHFFFKKKHNKKWLFNASFTLPQFPLLNFTSPLFLKKEKKGGKIHITNIHIHSEHLAFNLKDRTLQCKKLHYNRPQFRAWLKTYNWKAQAQIFYSESFKRIYN